MIGFAVINGWNDTRMLDGLSLGQGDLVSNFLNHAGDPNRQLAFLDAGSSLRPT